MLLDELRTQCGVGLHAEGVRNIVVVHPEPGFEHWFDDYNAEAGFRPARAEHFGSNISSDLVEGLKTFFRRDDWHYAIGCDHIEIDPDSEQ